MKRIGWWGLGLVLALGVWRLAPTALRNMDMFSLRRVEVVGSTYLTAEEVARTAQIPAGVNIFVDTEPFRLRVLAVRGVAAVEVRRRIPGAWVFTVVEFPVVAQAQIDGRLVLLDRRGRPLPFDPTRGSADLPIAEPDSAVTALVDRAADADPAFYASVERASRQQGTIILETAQHRILFRVGATTKDIQGASAVVTELARRRTAVAEVDARFEGRVVVRGGRS